MDVTLAPVRFDGVRILGAPSLSLRAWAERWVARVIVFGLAVVLGPVAILVGSEIGAVITAIL